MTQQQQDELAKNGVPRRGSITGLRFKMVGEDGNVFSIMGQARRLLKSNGRGDLVEAFTKECTSGDYQNALATCMKYFDCY